jgi:hypothetical protein
LRARVRHTAPNRRREVIRKFTPARFIPNSGAIQPTVIGTIHDVPAAQWADKRIPMSFSRHATEPLVTTRAPTRRAGATGGAEITEWQCAMEQLRELEYQFARARKAGNRDLMLRLRGEVESAALRSDLLLARAVEAARRGARSLPPMFSVDAKTARANAGRR